MLVPLIGDFESRFVTHLCDSCEYILDISFEKHITHMWTKVPDGGTVHRSLAYHPTIYIAPDNIPDNQYTVKRDRSLHEMMSILSTHDQVFSIQIVSRRLSNDDPHIYKVLKIKLLSFEKFDDSIKDFQDKNFQLYNIDLNHRQQVFLDTNATVMAAVHIATSTIIRYDRRWEGDTILNEYITPSGCVELDKIELKDDVADIDYFIPPLRIFRMAIDSRLKGTFLQMEDPIIAITIEEIRYENHRETIERVHELVGAELQILSDFQELIESRDPDILDIKKGDEVMIRYLATRFRKNYMPPLVLSRLGNPIYARESAGQTYMTYGQILRKQSPVYIPGRLHLDYDNSFMLYEAKLAGLIDLSRMGRMPPIRTSRASIGTVLTAVEFAINAETVPPTLVPPTKSRGELFKPALTLLIADNGGLTYPGEPGVYDNVWALDFTSMYPFIMMNHNVGGETVLCGHEGCKHNTVPELGYYICTRMRSVVTRTMGLVLAKRVLLKQYKKTMKGHASYDRYKAMNEGLKWILVTSFGYLGFKNSRWGSIEAHQVVTAYGRRILQTAARISSERGYEVIAGITDSLFLRKIDQRDDTTEKIEQLMAEISAEVRIPFDLEGKFAWVVFGNVRDYGSVAALNRYFGYFDHGEFKLRGIRSRQRRVTGIETQLQSAVLEHFAQAKTVEEFMQLIPSSTKLLSEFQQALINGEVDRRDLIIKLKSHKGSDGYKAKSTQQAMVTRKYQSLGHTVQAGESFRYVVANDKLRTLDRVIIEPELKDNSPYDIGWYCELLRRAFQELVEAPQHMQYGQVIYKDTSHTASLLEYF